jgi:predicted nucleotidyltransferase
MTRDDILATIRANEPRLRGEATDASDIDFLVEFDDKTFDNYLDTKELLETLFGRKVDLVIKSNIKPRLRDRILSEAVRAA